MDGGEEIGEFQGTPTVLAVAPVLLLIDRRVLHTIVGREVLDGSKEVINVPGMGFCTAIPRHERFRIVVEREGAIAPAANKLDWLENIRIGYVYHACRSFR